MKTVTKIVKDKHGFYTIWLNTDDKLQVSEDILVRFRLLKGQEVDDQTLTEIKRAGSYDRGLQLALNYLSYQLRTEREIRDYLKEHEIETQDRQKIIIYLKEIQLLDDQVFADSYVRTAMKTSDKGPRSIRQFLKQKGVADMVIDEALLHFTPEDQVASALRTAQRQTKSSVVKSYQETLRKIKQQLMQKGFDQEIIQKALENLEYEKDEDEELAGLQKQGEKLWNQHSRLEPGKRNMKIKQSLYRKGYSLDLIQQFITEKEAADEE